MKQKKTDLPKLLQKEGAIPKAVAALIRSLDATRSFSQNGKTVSEPDFATQTKAALGLLQWSASPPPRVSKDAEPPGPKLTPAERDEEIKAILGIE